MFNAAAHTANVTPKSSPPRRLQEPPNVKDGGQVPDLSWRSASLAALDRDSVKMLDKVYAGTSSVYGSIPSFSEQPAVGTNVAQSTQQSTGPDGDAKRSCQPKSSGTMRVLELLEMPDDTSDLASANAVRAEICSLLYDTFPFFQNFDESVVIKIARTCKHVQFAKGQLLFAQGDDEEDSLYFILHGSVDIFFHSSASKEQILTYARSWSEIDHHPSSGPAVEECFGDEIGVEGAGSILGENALLDDRLQQHKPMGTALASTTVHALRLSRSDLKHNGLLASIISRTPHVIHSPHYPSLVRFTKTAENVRSAEEYEFVKQMVCELPFFMNFHGSEKEPHIAFEILIKHLVIEPELAKTEVLWHQGSSIDEKRFVLHIILRGEVRHYCKRSGVVDPFDIQSIDWDDEDSVTRVIGKESAASSTVGNVIGGPAESSYSMAEDTVVAAQGCIFATISKSVWKQAMMHMTRPFLYKPQVVRCALAALDADSVLDYISPLPSSGQISAAARMPSFARMASFVRQPSLSYQTSADSSVHGDGLEMNRGGRSWNLASILIENFRFFSQVPLQQLALLCDSFRLVHVPAHEALCLQGNECKGIFVMLIGMAKVYSGALLLHRGHECKRSASFAVKNTRARNPATKSQLFNQNVDLKVETLMRQSSNTNVLSIHRKVSGLHPEHELEMLGQHHGELYCGDVVFEREAAHSLPCPASVVAGEHFFNAIFIDSETYALLARPLPPQTPPDWIGVGISMEDIPLSMRSSEQNKNLAASFQNVPGFEHLDMSLLRELAKHIEIMRLDMQSEIVQFGRQSYRICVLLEGTVSIHDPLRNGRRRVHGNASKLSSLGTCVRIGIPGEEPFGLTSIILSCDQWNTVVCRSDCLFYVLDTRSMHADLYRRFESACRKNIPHPAYMQQDRVNRKDHQILNIVSSLVENPYFTHLSSAAQQRLATTIQMLEFGKGDLVSSGSTMPGAMHLAIVNKGSVCTMAQKKGYTSIMNAVRVQCFRPQHSSRGRTSDAMTEASGPDQNQVGRTSASLSRTPSAAVSLSKMSPTRITRAASIFTRMGSSGKSRWSSTLRDLMPRNLEPANQDADHANVIVATYGQGFWDGVLTCFAHENHTEVLMVNKSEWRMITNMLSNADVSKMQSFVANHPCFQDLKDSELQNLIQHTRLTCLEELDVLFSKGDSVSELFFVVEGGIVLQTDIALERSVLSAGEKHVIPGVTVTSLEHQSIINDFIDLTADVPAEVLGAWLAHRERYSAMARTKCTLLAISKTAIVSLLNVERRVQIMQFKEVMDSFHNTRCGELELARESIMRGHTVLTWNKPAQKSARDGNEIINDLRRKSFAHHMPRVFIPPFARHVLESEQERGASSMANQGYLPALVSPRYEGVKMPYSKWTWKSQLTEELPTTRSPGHQTRFSPMLRKTPSVSTGGERASSTSYNGPGARSSGGAAGFGHQTLVAESSHGEHPLSMQFNNIKDLRDSFRRCTFPAGETQREKYMRNGRPGCTVINAVTKPHMDRKLKERETRFTEGRTVSRHRQVQDGKSPGSPTSQVLGRSVHRRKEYELGDVLRSPGAKPLSPLFPSYRISIEDTHGE